MGNPLTIHETRQCDVLIVGAGGGIGTFAVQIAKSFGAEVTGVCSASKLDLVRSIGADHVIDYALEDFTEGEKHYDLVLDSAAFGLTGCVDLVCAALEIRGRAGAAAQNQAMVR